MIKHSNIRYSEYLPTEGRLSERFSGSREQLVSRIFDAMAMCGPLQDADDRFDIVYPDNAPFPHSPPALLHFLEFLVGLLQPRRILEIGTYIGVSALYMASQLPKDGYIITLEKYEVFAAVARRNFEVNAKDHLIRCLTGDAWDAIASLGSELSTVDMVFLDANKERYWDYFETLAPMLPPGCLFIVDDAFLQGEVLNEVPTSEKATGVLEMLERSSVLTDWARILLPICDGCLLLYKRR